MVTTNPGRRRHPWWIFRASRTPPGLYARQKWHGEDATPRWREDFDKTVAELRDGQRANGLWQDSALATVHRLFGLHLTLRETDPLIDKALDALVGLVSHPPSIAGDDPIPHEQLRGLPFALGRWGDIATPAVLFLGTIFERSSDPAVFKLYERMVSDLVEPSIESQAPSKVHNVFRALVVHPHFAAQTSTQAVVLWYAQRQTPQGDWGAAIPFYQALNALAHLDTPSADKQCRKAFDSLPTRHSADGSWGQVQPEWETFLTTHALHNKGRLSMP